MSSVHQQQQLRRWEDLPDDALFHIFTMLPQVPYWYSLQKLSKHFRAGFRQLVGAGPAAGETNTNQRKQLCDFTSIDFINASMRTKDTSSHEQEQEQMFNRLMSLILAHGQAAERVSRLLLPSSIAFSASQLKNLLYKLPNLKKLTFSHNYEDEILDMMGADNSEKITIGHRNLEEVDIVRLINGGAEYSYIVEPFFRSNGKPKNPFPALKRIRFVCCENCIDSKDSLKRIQKLANNTTIKQRTWQGNGRALEISNDGVTVDFFFEQKSQKATSVVAPLGSLRSEAASYLIYSIGLLPRTKFRVCEKTCGTIVDAVFVAGSNQKDLHAFLSAHNDIDLHSALRSETWDMIFFTESNERAAARASVFAKLARAFCNGRLLQAADLRHALLKLGDKKKKKEYIKRIIDVLRIMAANGWDMDGDDYVFASIPVAEVFDAMVELGQKAHQLGKREQFLRFCQLLEEAIMCTSFVVVMKLLGLSKNSKELAGAVLNEKTNLTLLHGALDNVEAVPYGFIDFLVQQNPCDVRTIPDGYSYLHKAARTSSASVILTILKLQVDINAQDEKKNTMLHYLCERGLMSLAELVVEKYGANPAITNHEGLLPVELLRKAFKNSKKEPKGFMVDRVEIPTSLLPPMARKRKASAKEETTMNAPGALHETGAAGSASGAKRRKL